MKAIFSFLAMLFVGQWVFGQTAITNKINRAPVAASTVRNLHHAAGHHTGSRSGGSIDVNYTLLEDSAATVAGYSPTYYSWDINTNYPVDSFHNYFLKWGYQAVDI